MKFFARKHSALRLVLDPTFKHREMGRTTTESLTGKTKLGLTVEFVNGVYETDDPKIIRILKEHDGYGLAFYSDEAGEVATPTVAAVAAQNEKKAYAEDLASTCPECGNKFGTVGVLNSHMKVHKQ